MIDTESRKHKNIPLTSISEIKWKKGTPDLRVIYDYKFEIPIDVSDPDKAGEIFSF